MPFSGQDYFNYGWGYVNPNINRSYTWKGYAFPGGVVSGSEAWWNAILDKVVPLIKGGIHPGGYAVAGTWGYANRANVNSPGRPSFHAGGLALDVNAPWNSNGTQPGSGQWQLPRSVSGVVSALGGQWGGDWRDPMHIECHLSTAEMAAFRASSGGGKPPAATPPKPATPPAAKPPAATPPKPAGTTAFPLPAKHYFGPLAGPKESISGMTKSGSDHKYRPHIKRIQQKVGVAADGLYGANTIAAVKRWQSSNKVAADGLTGPKTWSAMRL